MFGRIPQHVGLPALAACEPEGLSGNQGIVEPIPGAAIRTKEDHFGSSVIRL
jgi:hypothetical protein